MQIKKNSFLGQMNYRTTPSASMMYLTNKISSGKRSPPTPPLQFFKHSRTESIPTPPSTHLHFPMNNSSY